jgi:methylenetetrahydrofolate dehydrogenase (NADP+) / methenyltetrahydrofolate cyclohydrolase
VLNIPKYPILRKDWVENKRLSGKKLALAVTGHIGTQVESMSQKPGLAVLLVGEDAASQVYVRNKEKTAVKAGFKSILKRLPVESSEEDVLGIVREWNEASDIHGILVQLPLPQHLDADKVTQSIHPSKDADGFHVINAGRLSVKEQGTIPCTPLGVILMLRLLEVELAGKNALVLGRSNIVGLPMALLLLNENCTVTVAHSKSLKINELVSKADILVAAMGRRNVVDCLRIKKGAIVIDVGMHRVDDKLCGDLDQEMVEQRAGYFTPVPGGVGPMTIAMLMQNTLENKRRLEKGNV